MSDRVSRKILVQRPSKVRTDGSGRAVWAEPVESAEFELVSTQMLKVMLSSRDNSDRKAIEETARSDAEGVLARNPATGRFELIGDDELQAILESNQDMPKISKPADATLEPLRDYVAGNELSLVSSQALRRVLDTEVANTESAGGDEELANGGSGFNPYDNG